MPRGGAARWPWLRVPGGPASALRGAPALGDRRAGAIARDDIAGGAAARRSTEFRHGALARAARIGAAGGAVRRSVVAALPPRDGARELLWKQVEDDEVAAARTAVLGSIAAGAGH